MKTARLLLIVALCLGTSGCLFSGKKAVVAAPPPAPQPAAAAMPLPPLPVPKAIPEPPEPPPLPVAENPAPSAVPAPGQIPQPPKQTVRRKPSPFPPAPAGTPAPAAANASVAPAPELREIISGDQRRQYEAEFSRDVTRAGAALRQAAARPLNTGQQETSARIRTFLAQAAAARENDISTALQLARRADLLGQELLKSMK